MSESILRHPRAYGAHSPEQLASYVRNASHVDDLEHRVGELEETLDAMEPEIAAAEREGDNELVSVLCESYCRLNRERIRLQRQSLRTQLKMLEFESAAAKDE